MHTPGYPDEIAAADEPLREAGSQNWIEEAFAVISY
jgi:hypothetical protein